MSEKIVLILKHVPNEDAGTIKDFLRENRIPFQPVDLYDGQSLPASLEGVRALVIMGGPMNVDDEDKCPFLKEENSFIKQAIQQSVPCLGICLGSQLIAKALGRKVYKAKAKEIGWDDVQLTEAAKTDSLFSSLNYPVTRVLQWHEDTFDLPEGAVLLASSRVAPHQAYRYKTNVYGLQFHVEVDRPMLEDWFARSSDLPAIISEYEAYRPALERMTFKMYSKFFTGVV